MGNENNIKSKESKDLYSIPDYISFENLHEYIGIKELNLFQSYLHNIFTDLSIYNEKDDKNVINKIIFFDYMKLPIFISQKLFNSFDLNNNNYLEEKEFINGLTKLYCGTFYETLEIIFKLLDYDKDGKIKKEDVSIMLYYLLLINNTNIEEEKSFKKEIEHIINKTFSKSNGILNFNQFMNVIINKKSDVFLELICYFYQKKPFSKENIYLIKTKNNEDNIKNNNDNSNNIKIKLSKKKKGIRPSENILKSKTFKFSNKRIYSKKNKTTNYNMNNANFGEVIRMSNKIDLDKKERYFSPSNYLLQKNIRPLSNGDLTNKNNLNLNKEDNNLKIKTDNYFTEEKNEKISINQNINEIIYENWIYQILENNKIKKYYLVISNKDIYYFTDEKKNDLIGINHLCECIINEPKENEYKELENIKYYYFSINFINKAEIINYYNLDFNIIKKFYEIIKKEIGYIKFNDYYEYQEIIGKGKFGIVYLGTHKKTGKKVAIKIINKFLLKKEEDKELIKNEIDIMKLCNHPNIIKLLDHFENSEYIYIIMEYLSGGTLTQYIKKRYFNFSENQASNIIYQIGNGIKYLHNYCIIHRDLKTDNIMLTEDNENATIKIIDFGLSKIISSNESLIDGYGTLTFTAPEVLTREPYNKEIDIWSLGIILFYMLTGHFPFEGINEEIIAKKIVYQSLEFNSEEWETRSHKVKNLIEKCLKKKPSNRININEFLKHSWFKSHFKQKFSL